MGPPSPHQAREDGRYNRAGQPILYLSDSEYGVRRELTCSQGRLFAQEYLLPTTDLRICDLRQLGERSFLCAAMWYAELAGAEAYPPRLFSQAVAHIVSEIHDGMVLPGVRGERGRHYSNVVMFRPADRWREWIQWGSDPYEL